MTTDRIKEIQETTPYPESQSVQQALLQVWNECEQENKFKITRDVKEGMFWSVFFGIMVLLYFISFLILFKWL
jgi:hypothetical protein